MATILDRIVETKRREVDAARDRRSLASLKAAADQVPPTRDFAGAVTGGKLGEIRLIAEIKQKSPSAGIIVPDFDPIRIAATYHDCGASAISVLTDRTYFGGRLELIAEVKTAVPLPVLRKDFIVDAYQVYESRVAGADAILLIAEVIGAGGIASLLPVASALGLVALVEVHTEKSLASVIDAVGPPGETYILGINNRDLAAQRTDLSTTAKLASLLPPSTPFVTESGISTRRDVLAIQRAGASAMLVGEALLRAGDLAAKTRELLGGA